MEGGGPAPRSSRLACKYPGGWATPGLLPKRNYTVSENVGRPTGSKDTQERRKPGRSYRSSRAHSLHAARERSEAVQHVSACFLTALDGLERLNESERLSIEQMVLDRIGTTALTPATANTPSPLVGSTAAVTEAMAELTPAAAAANQTPATGRSTGAVPSSGSVQLPAKRARVTTDGGYKQYDHLGKRQRAARMKQISEDLKAACKADTGIEAYIQDYLAGRVDTLVKLVSFFREDIINHLDAQLRASVLAGGEQVPMPKAIAMRMCLKLSDVQYTQLLRFLPGTWFPSLDALRKAEAALCPEMSSVLLPDGTCGWRVKDIHALIKLELELYLQRGGQQRSLKYKTGTDNFSTPTFKKKLLRYQQVAMVILFDDPAVPAAGPAPAAPAAAPTPAPPAERPPLLPANPPLPLFPPTPPPAADFSMDELLELAWDACEAPSYSMPSLDDQDEQELASTPEVPFNSPLQMLPLALYKGPEQREYLEPLIRALEPLLPPKLTITVQHPTTGEDVVFTLERFNSGDFLAMGKLYGHAGQACKSNCIWCLLRHGLLGDDCADEQECVRDLANMWAAGLQAERQREAKGMSQASQLHCLPIVAETQVEEGVPADQLPSRQAASVDCTDPKKVEDLPDGMKYVPCTEVEPDHYVMEVLHALMNLVGSHLEHTCTLAAEVDVDLMGVIKGLGLERPVCGWEAHQCWVLLRIRDKWLEPLAKARHPEFSAIWERWQLLRDLLAIAKTPLPNQEQITRFGVLASQLGQLLKLHWGHSTGKRRYAFRFYDHALICHAAGQLRTYRSLFMFSSYYLEHANKWWKRFLLFHTSCGGGASELGRDPILQAVRKYCLLTHPTVREEVRAIMARRRGVYTCRGCGQPKYRGHTATCEAAQQLKAGNRAKREAELLASAVPVCS